MAREQGMLAALRNISAGVEVLPEVRDHLARLDVQIDEMIAEVKLMRAGVDELGGEVKRLNGSVDGLDEQFSGLRADVGGLEGHLEGVRASLAPLTNALGGVGRIGDLLRGSGRSDETDAA